MPPAWLAFHRDNRGPQTADEVVEGIAAVKRTFPNAKVLPLSTMDAWTTELLAAQSSLSELALPKLVDIEPGSTWVYGIASDPMKMRNYRAVRRQPTTVHITRTLADTVTPISDLASIGRVLLLRRLFLTDADRSFGSESVRRWRVWRRSG